MARLECLDTAGRSIEAGATRDQGLALQAGQDVRLTVRNGHVFPL